MSHHDFFTAFMADAGWQVVHHAVREPRSEERHRPGGLEMKPRTYNYLRAMFPEGIYRHQVEALSRTLLGSDVAMCTGTASGKSAVFYATAIEALSRDPNARILALYPLKALGREQEGRWREALRAAGMPGDWVARVDGDVPTGDRPGVLRTARVIVGTPDIVHAWLLPNIVMDEVWDFVQCLRVLVVDEVHVYTGVFGTHAAFLYRRLQHLANLAQSRYQCVAASATIRDPGRHLESLFGRSFELIDESVDTSAQHRIDLFMAQPPTGRDLTSSVTALLEALVSRTEAKFIAFVDSRKQVETMATVLARTRTPDDGADRFAAALTDLDVLPYRAGYEDDDRREIERKLSRGELRGVVSTSALELGIDIPHLDVGVLIGVPRSRTNLQQRIGRVARRRPGTVVIVNAGDVFSEAMFRCPEDILARPLAESALYLENTRVQYIHAMCLARPFGEHEQARQKSCSSAASEDVGLSTDVDWPPGFLSLVAREQTGEVPVDLQAMKTEAGETPHLAFPLRHTEREFEVELRQGPDRMRLGTLSHGQVMRETYPGAVYYHITKAYRVTHVSLATRSVRVKREKRYTTRPIMVPAMLYPNLGEGSVHRGVVHGPLVLVEADLQVRESVVGYKERRGPQETTVDYPLRGAILFGQRAFTRNFFTTGALIEHPALNDPGVKTESLAALIFECFLMEIPFDRQDLSYGSGTLKVSRGPLQLGQKFIAVYDQTCGSLRLSGRLLDDGVLRRICAHALELARTGYELLPVTTETIACLTRMMDAVGLPRTGLALEGYLEAAAATDEDRSSHRIRIIMPGSLGLNTRLGNEEFEVEGVFYSPGKGLTYRGHRASSADRSAVSLFAVEEIIPIAGESREGWYDQVTGQITEE